MFHSVSLLSQAPLARRSCALPSVLFVLGMAVVLEKKEDNTDLPYLCRPRIILYICPTWKIFPILILLDQQVTRNISVEVAEVGNNAFRMP